VDGRPVTDYTIHSFVLPLVPAGYTGALEFRVNLPVGGRDVQPLLVPFNGQPFATADGPDADTDPDIDPEYVRAHVDAAIAYTRDVLGVPPPSDVAFLTQYITGHSSSGSCSSGSSRGSAIPATAAAAVRGVRAIPTLTAATPRATTTHRCAAETRASVPTAASRRSRRKGNSSRRSRSAAADPAVPENA
jgi:hypothetical protein